MDLEASLQAALDHEIAGALALAEQEYRRVLDAVRGSGSPLERDATKNLARLCANDGREFEALAFAVHARDLCIRAGDPWRLALSRLQMANALDGIDDYARIPPILNQIEGALDLIEPPQAGQLRVSIALHRARLAANLGDVDLAREEFGRVDRASRAVTGRPVSPRIEWFVNVVALNAAGRYGEVEPWLERTPPSEGMVRRELEYTEQRVRCLLALRPEPDGRDAATAFLTSLREAPAGTVGPAWRLRAAAALGTRLAALEGAGDLARSAWDVAGHAILVRLRQIEDCVEALPEVAMANGEVSDLLTDYRLRFRDRHEELMREVAATRPWPPIDSALFGVQSGLIVVCAWCTRVRTIDGRWVPIRQFLPQQGEQFMLSHGICAACWARSEGDLDAYARWWYSYSRRKV
ncbi:MAG TPA: hypothetical protein VG871_13915 [Vicinamibacterales bacterium]|nr:hypothetical protein [Vicinamibacterales bacterium]